MDKLLLADLSFRGKKVLMRVDFNVPLNPDGGISDDSRIRAAIPSIEYILKEGGSLILMSHLGRPKGKKNPEFSLKPCAKRLQELIPSVKVMMAPDCIGPTVKKMVDELQAGSILLLENLRYYPGEEEPEKHPEFVSSLAELGDIYINDAFGSSHRAHASITAITQYFPNKAAAGFSLEKEIRFLGDALSNPDRPFYAIVGGAKISTKIGALRALLKKTDKLFIGGAMAFTFFKAQGIAVGDSLIENDLLESASSIMEESRLDNRPLILPVDVLIAETIQENSKSKIIEIDQGIPDGWHGVDIGPKTIQLYIQNLQDAKTVFWNGPMGIFEIKPFSKGTFAIAEALSKLNATTIVGGGDSLAAVHAADVSDCIKHLSTGGGAALEYIEFGSLPGISALRG